MFSDNEYRVHIGISEEAYRSKPEGTEVSRMVFDQGEYTVIDTFNRLISGHAICNRFGGNGKLPIRDKSNQNYVSSNLIMFDFDHTVMDMDAFTAALKITPTFSYSTYSDGKGGMNSFRLGYAIDQEIYGAENYTTVSRAIASINGFTKFDGWDERSCAQMYYGTNSTAKGRFYGHIYSLDDIGVTDITKIAPDQPKMIRREKVPETAKGFLKDLYLPFSTFDRKYGDKYGTRYEQSLHTELIDVDGMWWEIPDDYREVPRKKRKNRTLKWGVGEGRKKMVFLTMLIMKHNVPDITFEELMYNMLKERFLYYDNSDNKISVAYLISTAKGVLDGCNLNNGFKFKHKFKLNKKYWSSKGIGVPQARKIVESMRKEKAVLSMYDHTKTLKENREMMIEAGMRISVKFISDTLKKMSQKTSFLKQDIYTYIPYTFYNKNAENVAENVAEKLTERQKNIIKLIDNTVAVNTKYLSEKLNVNRKTIQRDVKYLQEINIIHWVGADKGGHWQVNK